MLRCLGFDSDSDNDDRETLPSSEIRSEQPCLDKTNRKTHIYTKEFTWRNALHHVNGVRVHSIDNETAAHNKALFIHKELAKEGYIEKLVHEYHDMKNQINIQTAEPVFVYMGSSYGECIFAIALTESGKNLGVLFEKNVKEVENLWQGIRNGFDYRHAIRSVVLFDSLYAHAKLNKCPVLPECANVSQEWDNDFKRFFQSEISYEPIGFNKCQKGFLGGKKTSDPSFIVIDKFNTNMRANPYFNIKKDTVSYIESNTLVKIKPSTGEILSTHLITVLDVERVVDLIHSSSESKGS
jgi:hypothetical protein